VQPAGEPRLADVLDKLEGLAGPAAAGRVVELRRRLASARLRLLVVGEAKRGKSTVVNALLGRAVLPVGVTPVTSIATTVTWGDSEAVEVDFFDGRTEVTGLDGLAVVTEEANPANRLGVRQVVVRLPAPLVASGVEIVDTPGTGSVHEHNTRTARAALGQMDAAVFVLSADPPVSAAERALLVQVADTAVEVFVLLNKADRLDPTELRQAHAFTAGVVADALGRPVDVIPVSARQALRGRGAGDDDDGFAEFRQRLEHYLAVRGATDLQRSVARAALRLSGELLDEVAVTLGVLDADDTEGRSRVRRFEARLAAVEEARVGVADQLAGETSRLLRALNTAAAQAERELVAEIAARLDAELAEPASGPAADLQRIGRKRLVQLTTTAVERWRREQAAALEESLRGLYARLVGTIEREVRELADAAAEELSVRLVTPFDAPGLAEPIRFFYAVGEDIGQTELLAGVVRRHLPGTLGRRRVLRYLLGSVDGFVNQQVGRARADLQARLAETSRRLRRLVDEQYAATADRLRAAVTAAAATATLVGAERASTRRQLTARAAELTELRQLLAAEPAATAGAAS